MQQPRLEDLHHPARGRLENVYLFGHRRKKVILTGTNVEGEGFTKATIPEFAPTTLPTLLTSTVQFQV